MSFLPGMFAAAAAAGAGSQPGGLTYKTRLTDTADQQNYTFSAVDIGIAAANRRVFVAAASRATAEKTLDSITIGGASATLHVNLNSASTSSDTDIAIGSRLVASGETADIVVNHSGTCTVCAIAVWIMYGETDSSPYATANDTVISGQTLSLAIDIPSNGILIAATTRSDGAGSDSTWTGATEKTDGRGGDPIMFLSAASETALSSEAGRSVQVTGDGLATANTALLAALSWQYTP